MAGKEIGRSATPTLPNFQLPGPKHACTLYPYTLIPLYPLHLETLTFFTSPYFPYSLISPISLSPNLMHSTPAASQALENLSDTGPQ